MPGGCKTLSKALRQAVVFLYRVGREPTNNMAERALHPSVIHRKVMGCFRSEWGAKAFAALASVFDTVELSGIHPFAAIQALFGPPSLPILAGVSRYLFSYKQLFQYLKWGF